jgi:hypothetical protein
MAKMNVNDVLGKKIKNADGSYSYTALSTSLAKNFALNAPQLVPDALRKMKGSTLKNFDVQYRAILGKENVEAGMNATKDPDRLAKSNKAMESYEKAFGNNSFGFSPSEGGGASSPPPAASPASH